MESFILDDKISSERIAQQSIFSLNDKQFCVRDLFLHCPRDLLFHNNNRGESLKK